MFLINLVNWYHFQLKVVITQVTLSSVVEQWKLVHLASVLFLRELFEVIHCTNCVQSKWLLINNIEIKSAVVQ